MAKNKEEAIIEPITYEDVAKLVIEPQPQPEPILPEPEPEPVSIPSVPLRIPVRAIATGYYGDVLYHAGGEFTISSERHFSKKWMEKR